jgi:hypothetical protein
MLQRIASMYLETKSAPMHLIERILDRYRSPQHRRSKSVEARIWGNGIVDQSLDELWGAITWDDVSADELTLLIPTLSMASGCAAQRQLHAILRTTLTARSWQMAVALSVRNGVSMREAAIEVAERCPGVGISVEGLIAGGAAAAADLGCAIPIAQGIFQGVRPPHWAFDPDCLQRLESAVGDLAADSNQQASNMTASRATRRRSLVEALALSIDSGVNGAYVYPDHSWAHELLSTGAWIGHLTRGRPALLPPGIAGCLVEYLGAAKSRAMSDDIAQCTALLERHVEVAIGRRRLMARAERVLTTSCPLLVGPVSTYVRWQWGEAGVEFTARH